MPIKLSGQYLKSGSIPTTALGGGVVSSSGQITVNTVTYMTASNPTLTVNPTTNGAIWLNSASGEYFVCSNSSSNANEWIGSSGSYVFPPTALTLVIANTSLTGSNVTSLLTITSNNRLGRANLFASLPTFTSSSNSGSVNSIVNNGTSVTATYTQNYVNGATTVGVTASYGAYSASGSISYTNIINGGLWAWGRNTSAGNTNGILGTNDAISKSSPVQVGALTNWMISGLPAAGYLSAMVKSDGTLWTWGNNTYGELGQNDAGTGATLNRSSPIQVGALTNWSKVATGQYNMLAIKTDGTLWAWGRNSYGALGTNDTVSYSSPVQIGALTNWADVDVYQSAIARKTDGTLWTWGRNNYGQLGLNISNLTNNSSPVQIGTGTSWAYVTAGYEAMGAITNTGTMWAWGYNGYGQVGDTSQVSRSSPVQVGALTNWSQAAVGNRGESPYGTSVAVKTDGTLWSWGGNYYGSCGLNDNGNTPTGRRSSPVQVGALTNWSFAQQGYYHTIGTKTDGTLWSWGRNNFGQLGQGDGVSRSSPVQIGALTTWKRGFAGYNYSMGLKL
jgi:alpha-tubulin suppressor-like RCC1 family protein